MSENTTFVKRKFVWELTGKEKMMAYEVGNYIQSEVYDVMVDGKVTQWFLELYPNGSASDEQNYLGLYLCAKKPILADFDANYKFGIVSNKTDFISEGEVGSSEEFKANDYGSSEWIQRDLLLQTDKEYFADDKLTIFCELTILALPGRQMMMETDDDPTIDFSKMFAKEGLKDCEIHTSDGEILKFHKTLLAARSDVFYKMFTIDMTEAKSNVVKIEDFNAETLTQLLRFAYCLEVENLGKIAHDLVFAAEKYQIAALKKICLSSLFKDLDQKNVLQSFVIADKISDADILLDKCVLILAGNSSNYKALSETTEWKNLSHSTKDKIIGRLIQYNDGQKIYKSAQF